MEYSSGRSEIAFFDVETTVPTRPGEGCAILEFGSILVCPRKLEELESYSTLVRPNDPSLISTLSDRSNGITRDAIDSAPTFAQVADKVYDILNGRVWAGHNIVMFDCDRIKEAFSEINRPAPQPRDTIDSFPLLTQKFGRRAGDMKMATLATYFKLGRQTHRSLDDVRMNLEVLKYCATVLFLESSFPDIFKENRWVSSNAATRKVKFEHQNVSATSQSTEGNHPILSLVTPNTVHEVSHHTDLITPQRDHCNMGSLNDKAYRSPLPLDVSMDEKSGSGFPESSAAVQPEGPIGCADFLEPKDVSIPSINVSLAPVYRGPQRMQILHKDNVLQIFCTELKVRFNVSSKYVDHAGKPRLSFVADATASLCQVLDECDSLAQRLFVESGNSSKWRSMVNRKDVFFKSPTVRLQIPTVADGNVVRWVTEIYDKKSSSASPQRLVFSSYNVAELEALFIPGTFVDAYFSLDSYDYQQNAGMRLVAKKLVVHST